MFYVISGGLQLQTSMLLLSQVSKFEHPKKWMLLVQQVLSVTEACSVSEGLKRKTTFKNIIYFSITCTLASV